MRDFLTTSLGLVYRKGDTDWAAWWD